jgi:hypothetical protein
MVKTKLGKNGFKHYFSNSINSDKAKEALKRIPRRTNRFDNTIIDNQSGEKQSIYKNMEETAVKI